MGRHRDFKGHGPLEFIAKKKRQGRISMSVMLLVMLFVVLLPPIYLAGPFAAATGLPVFWARLLTCFVWVVVLYGLLWLAFWALRRHVGKRRDDCEKPRNMFDDALDALDRIAQGDYTVVLEPDEHYHYTQLTDKINHLARQLSSMEQMRQDFVSNVSHEIRSPLTSIAGFAELLRKPDLTEAERGHYLDVIQSETERMSRLSDSLLRLSMLDNEATTLNPAPFRVDKQIETVLLGQEPQWAEKDIELDVDLAEATCTCDEELLLQVWQNLLHNAVKFTPQGGHIRVALTQEGGDLCCLVADDGIGIPPEELVHIFERFYKVDKARDRKMGGNGLGLPLAKRIVELHGGHISVESQPQRGTTFTVVLPCGGPAQPAE